MLKVHELILKFALGAQLFRVVPRRGPDPSTGAISAALQPPAASGGPRRDDPTGKRVEYDSSKTITSGHGGLNRKFLEILIRDDKIRTSRVAAARDWTETKVGRREEANIWVSISSLSRIRLCSDSDLSESDLLCLICRRGQSQKSENSDLITPV